MRLTQEQIKSISHYSGYRLSTRKDLYEFIGKVIGYEVILKSGYELRGNGEVIKLTMYRFHTDKGTLYSIRHIKLGKYVLYEFDEYGKKLFDIYA